jgi:hypothetical protein
MGRPELIEDPRFATMRDRAKNRYELAAIVEAWMQAQPSTEAVLKILEEHRGAGDVGGRHGEPSALQGAKHDSHRARPDPGRGDDSRIPA